MELIARNWIVQTEVGLLSKVQLVMLADNYITENDEFPDWMVKISLSESLAREPKLDLILEPITLTDAQLVAKELLSLYINQSITISKIGQVAEKLYLALEWGSEAFNLFIWISDEVDLINDDNKSEIEFKENIQKVLCEIIAL